MPELPEVQTVASELSRKLKNRRIRSVVVNSPEMVAIGPAALSPKRQVESYKVIKFINLLKGQKILSVKRRAKLLIFDFFGPWSMLVHLKMTGQFIFEDKKLRAKTGGRYRLLNKSAAPLEVLPSKHTHVIFEFTDASKLYFNDVRKFGYLKLVPDSQINEVKELKEFGPEPLERKFTLLTFFTIVKNVSNRKIKEVLMDPKVVAGIGNIYSDEILFLSGVRPERKVVSINNQALRKIYTNIKKVLIRAIKARGSSVGDFVRTDGSWGKMGKYHFVYGRKGQKCKKCGSIILSVKMSGRTASYCPKCQE
ncbi:MAG: bifunctional DNA-formamidopyrimidine glycosylase/DNA-(apurinic or apyrimidinic site) lyase [Candidatus Doudnabacteria bacterium]|nr:bifunctional DNA-formamidopyrimidine glycosylase/DNA-(apurinic or apyrimidinic site) lyase [Candidatus Doudnabacteria bacterium]